MRHVSAFAILVVSFLPFQLTLPQKSASQTAARPPSDKIHSVISTTVGMLKGEGVTAQNAMRMRLKEKYNSLITRFDDEGRFGLILDVKEVSPDLLNRLRDFGASVVMSLPKARLVSVYMPIDRIEDVAALDEVRIVRPITGGVKNAGSKTSEGDSLHHAVNVRTDLNVLGDTVHVGVISDGCASWKVSQASGDLPAGFDSTNFIFGDGNKIGTGDEGTAMMEIIHDLAPNARLFFYGALHDPAGVGVAMVDAIHRLVSEKHCKIIVDDLTAADQPMFEDATAATAWTVAENARQAVIGDSIIYISSAGNYARGGSTNRSHYQAQYSDINPAPPAAPLKPLPNGPIPAGVPPPPPFDNLHNFNASGGFDPGLQVTTLPGETLTVILEWNESWFGSADDYDLYLYDTLLVNRLASSVNVQNGAQPAYEIISYKPTEPFPIAVNIVINHFGAGAPPKLLGMYIWGCGSVEYHTAANSIWGQPGASEVIAVGAVPYINTGLIEDFSSRGNYDVYFPAFESRPKPDVVAVDGVTVSGAGGFEYFDGANWRFSGTSAAAPHVAGMAALLMSKCPSMPPAQVRAKFHRTAIDLGTSGFDATYGYGFLDVERAMLEVDTSAGARGPFSANSTVNIPQFFATPDGFAVSTQKVTGGAHQPTQLGSTVHAVNGNPYLDAGLANPGCPTLQRWYGLTKIGGVDGQFDARITAYVDESERAAASVPAGSMRLIHWNGAIFEILPQTIAPVQIGNTWKVSATFNNASFSPFFVGYLARAIAVTGGSHASGLSGATVTAGFSIQNTGNGWDTLSYHAHDTRGWIVSPVDTSFSLNASQRDTVSLSVTISVLDSAGTIDTVWLDAKSVSDSSVTSSAYVTVTKTSTVTVTYNLNDGWNMVSVPVSVSDLRKDSLFPTAISPAFDYDGGYVRVNVLDYGCGYWVKFNGAQHIELPGRVCEEDSIQLSQGWNMIGSISYSLSVDSILQVPPGIVVSRYYAYSGSYQIADSIIPTHAYWVRTRAPGNVVFRRTPPGSAHGRRASEILTAAQLNSLRFSDALGNVQVLYFGTSNAASREQAVAQLPPLPPGDAFDVRFHTQRFLERFPTNQHPPSIPIDVQCTAYPLTVRWEVADPDAGYVLAGADRTGIPIRDSGSYVIDDPSIRRLILSSAVVPEHAIPRSFALEQNYPNPFNPATLVKYALPVESEVSFRVYNVLGKQVMTVVDRIQPAGYIIVSIDASKLATGVYYYRLEATGVGDPSKTFAQVRKMVVMR